MDNHLIKTILFGLSIIIACNVVGHFLPPFSLMLSAVYINLIIGLVNRPLYEKNFKLTVAYNFLLLFLNDIFIRLYAGGTHDNQGKGWCFLMYFIGLIIAAVLMFVYAGESEKKERIKNILIIISGLAISVIIYWNFNASI